MAAVLGSGAAAQERSCSVETAPPRCRSMQAAQASALTKLRLRPSRLPREDEVGGEASPGEGGAVTASHLVAQTSSTGPRSLARARSHRSPGDQTQPRPSASASAAAGPVDTARASAVSTSPTAPAASLSRASSTSGQYSPRSATSSRCMGGCSCRLSRTTRAAASALGTSGGSAMTNFPRAKSSVRTPSRWTWLRKATVSKSTLSKSASTECTSAASASWSFAAPGSSFNSATRVGTGSQSATTRKKSLRVRSLCLAIAMQWRAAAAPQPMIARRTCSCGRPPTSSTRELNSLMTFVGKSLRFASGLAAKALIHSSLFMRDRRTSSQRPQKGRRSRLSLQRKRQTMSLSCTASRSSMSLRR
mmetsp:Transcript_84827/g.263857  ORF Transcript_84827/g.263857 Transcript_84827/m.263857 type:complete len:362 (-) Transcript_84827:196-1281(-)